MNSNWSRAMRWCLLLSLALGTTCRLKNHRPEASYAPNGMTTGKPDSLYLFNVRSADPDGDSVAYQLDWGDSMELLWAGFRPSDSVTAVAKSWHSVGDYTIRARTRDGRGALSDWSPASSIRIRNDTVMYPPVALGILSGSDTVRATFYYEYKTLAIDPEGDSVQIRIDWGDGGISDWSSWLPSGETLVLRRAYVQQNVYWIRVQARDKQDSVSAWTEPRFLLARDAGVAWSATFGGYGTAARSISRATLGSGHVVAGEGRDGVLLARIDDRGGVTWSRSYGIGEEGHAARQTRDGGFVAVGRGGDAPYGDMILLRTDAEGNLAWYRTYGTPGRYGEAMGVVLTSDGGYYMVGTESYGGTRNADIRAIKTDSIGDTLWTRTYGGDGPQYAVALDASADGGYFIVGDDYSSSDNVLLMKTDVQGDIVWQLSLGGQSAIANGIRGLSDGGCAVVGSVEDTGIGDATIWLVRVSAGGIPLWEHSVDQQRCAEGYGVDAAGDTGFVVVGLVEGTEVTGNAGMYYARLDDAGNLLWERILRNGPEDAGHALVSYYDGMHVLVGVHSSQAFVTKIDDSGP